MPLEKKITKPIYNLYKKNAENLGLFFFVKGQQSLFPTIKIEQAIMGYFRFMGITLDDWDMECAKTIFTRLQNDYYEMKHDESSKKN